MAPKITLPPKFKCPLDLEPDMLVVKLFFILMSKFLYANLNLKNVKAFQKDTHVICTPTKKKPKKIFEVDAIWKFQDVRYMKMPWANLYLMIMEIFQ